MVDPIEVKLDTDDIEVMKNLDKSVKEMIKTNVGKFGTLTIDETKKSPGVLDAAIKSLTGGSKFGGMIASGAAAGGVAGAVLILADVMKEAVKQSKIASKITESVNNAIGLMMDLVLVPFIPALVWALINLYGGIISFGDWWAVAWETIQKEGLVGLLKLALQWSWGILQGWEKAILEWFFGDKTIGEKTVDLVVGFKTLLGGVFGYLHEKLIATVIDFLFGEGTAENIKEIVLNIAASLLDFGITWIKALLNFFFGEGGISEKAITIAINVVKKIEGTLTWLWDLLKAIITGDFSKGFDLFINLIPKIGGGNDNNGGTNIDNRQYNNTTNNGFDLFGMIGSAARNIYNESQRLMDSRYSAGGA